MNFPTDMWFAIAAHIHDEHTLFQLARTCKHLQHIIKSLPKHPAFHTWSPLMTMDTHVLNVDALVRPPCTTLNLRSTTTKGTRGRYRLSPERQNIETLINWAANRLVSLTIKNFDTCKWNTAIAALPHLKHLALVNGTHPQGPTAFNWLAGLTLEHFTYSVPATTRFGANRLFDRLATIKTLTKINLAGNTCITATNLDNLLTNAPPLLNTLNIAAPTAGGHTLILPRLTLFLKTTPSLKHLTIDHQHFAPTAETITTAALVSFSAVACTSITSAFFENMIKNIHTLLAIDISHIDLTPNLLQIAADAHVKVIKMATDLHIDQRPQNDHIRFNNNTTHLDIAGFRGTLARHQNGNTALTTLAINNCNDITPTHIATLVAQSPHLTTLEFGTPFTHMQCLPNTLTNLKLDVDTLADFSQLSHTHNLCTLDLTNVNPDAEKSLANAITHLKNLKDLSIEFATFPDSYNCETLNAIKHSCLKLVRLVAAIKQTRTFRGWKWPAFPATLTCLDIETTFASKDDFTDRFGEHWTAHNYGANKSLITDTGGFQWLHNTPLIEIEPRCWTDKAHIFGIYTLPCIRSIHIEQIDWMDDSILQRAPPQLDHLHLTGGDSLITHDAMCAYYTRSNIAGRSILGERWVTWDALF